MDLPVKFPSETEVILEDVARFRALSPRDRIRAIENLLADGAYLMSISPKADWARQYAEEQKHLAQRNIRGVHRTPYALSPQFFPGDSVRAVESLAEAFDARSIRYALIGGLAFVLRGRPRFTKDVDFLLDVPQIILPVLLTSRPC